MIAAAAPQIADPLVRNLGTIGGSLTHCDPSGDLGSVMLAANARVVLRSSTGEREVPMTDFVVSTFQSSIEPTELLTQIRITSPTGRYGGTYLKLERKIGDYATVATATRLMIGDDGTISLAGIGLTSVGLTNIKATAAEASLIGTDPRRGRLRRSRPGRRRGIQPRDRRAGHRGLQAAHGRGVRPARAHPRRRTWPARPREGTGRCRSPSP